MFEDFLGNEELKKEISTRILSGTLPHAIIFSGEEGTGCDYFSRLVAEAYLEDRNGLVLRNVHPDFVTIQGSGASGQVAVADVRDALYEMNKASVMTEGRRVLHIRQAENLNVFSSNALLKMMEEPPEGVVFILTVRRLDDLLATIQSRAVNYRVRPLSVKECADAAVRSGVATDQAERYSELFGGRLGLVLKAANDQNYSFCVIAAERFLNSTWERDRYGMMESLARAENRDQLSVILKIVLSAVSVRIQNSPEDSAFAGKVYEFVSDAVEQNELYVNQRTVAAVLASKISKVR